MSGAKTETGFTGLLTLHQHLLRRSRDPWALGRLHPHVSRPAGVLRPSFAALQPYTVVAPETLAALDGLERLDELPASQLDTLLLEVVRAEGPVHLDVLIARLLARVTRSRSSARLRERILERLDGLAVAEALQQQNDDFSALPEQLQTPPWRDWRQQTERLRKLEHVHDRELMQALWRIVDEAPDGLPVEQASNDALHRIGFIRLTANARQRLQAPLAALLQAELLAMHDERLVVGRLAFVR